MRHLVTTTSCADAVSWCLIGGLASACLLVGHATGFGVLNARTLLPGVGVAVLGGALAIGRLRADTRLVAGATAFLQMTLFTILGVVLSYLLAAQAGPLWDEQLAAADQRLGLNWPTLFDAANHLPVPLLAIGGFAYHSLVAQMVLCILVLAGTGRMERLRIMIAAAILSGVTTVVASGVLPAIGNLFDPDRYKTLWPSVAWLERTLVLGLRNGTVRQVDLSHLTGIVSFPSYHAALPLILAWGVRPVNRLRIPAMVWAGLTIAATPLFGGHYAVDVLAGMMLALASLVVASRLSSRHPDQVMLCSPFAGTRAVPAAGVHQIGSGGRNGAIHDVV
jgi:hypothetical protein